MEERNSSFLIHWITIALQVETYGAGKWGGGSGERAAVHRGAQDQEDPAHDRLQVVIDVGVIFVWLYV